MYIYNERERGAPASTNLSLSMGVNNLFVMFAMDRLRLRDMDEDIGNGD